MASRIEPLLRRMYAPIYRMGHREANNYRCPICAYEGPFRSKANRQDAKCPRCGALERARFQYTALAGEIPADQMRRVLHVAPEPGVASLLQAEFASYWSADLARSDVDIGLDVQAMPFPTATFDLVFASHVLEYPERDDVALAEIRRILAPGGAAILPVPLMHQRTVDRVERHPVTKVLHEPGLDYFDRMRSIFDTVDVIRSTDVDPNVQPFVRSRDRSVPMPLEASPGVFVDMMPICRVNYG